MSRDLSASGSVVLAPFGVVAQAGRATAGRIVGGVVALVIGPASGPGFERFGFGVLMSPLACLGLAVTRILLTGQLGGDL